MATKQAGTVSGESFARRHRNFVVGLFVVVPLAVVPLLCVYTLMKLEVWQQWDHLYVVYDRSYGLSSSNAVTISDYDIGHVGKVTLAGKNTTIILLKINPGYMPLIKKDARAQLAQKNLVGDWVISLKGGSDSARSVTDGDTLAPEYSLRLDVLAEQVAGMITNVDSIIRQVASGRGSIGKAIKEDSLVRQVEGILRNVNALTVQSAAMMRKADGLVDNLGKIGTSGVTLASSGVTMVDSVRAILSAVQKTLKDVPVIMENVKGASAEITPLMGQVKSELDDADAMMRGVQKNWLFQKVRGKQEDKMRNEAP
jgi:ABC-type transporter Mla subunit MlaD